MVKINGKMLVIPPYISTSWDQVASLRMEEFAFVVTLRTGKEIVIPDLKQEIIDAAFAAHALFLGGEGVNMTALQHDPKQAQAPDMPPEMVEKISSIAKILSPDPRAIPKAEPNCNCFFCQIARAVHKSVEPEAEEVVADKDLAFQEWEVVKEGDAVYTVTNLLDRQEKYSVYLGDPIGCTCGKPNCEHIVAVLRS